MKKEDAAMQQWAEQHYPIVFIRKHPVWFLVWFLWCSLLAFTMGMVGLYLFMRLAIHFDLPGWITFPFYAFIFGLGFVIAWQTFELVYTNIRDRNKR